MLQSSTCIARMYGYGSLAYRSTVIAKLDGDRSPPSLVAAEVNVTDETRPLTVPQMLLLVLFVLHQLNSEKINNNIIVQHIAYHNQQKNRFGKGRHTYMLQMVCAVAAPSMLVITNNRQTHIEDIPKISIIVL